MARSFVVCLSLTAIGFVGGCSSSPKVADGPGPAIAKVTPSVAATKGGSSPRRMVKNATDPDAGKIDTSPKDTTIEEIVSQKAPNDLANRQAPFETSKWRVKATVESVTYMKDQDYYLVLQGEKGGKTVVEVPDPELCKGSPLLPEITAARKAIEEKYHPTSTTQRVHDQATVTGVGFLGWGAGGKGGSGKNAGKKGATGGIRGPRLMPGTGIDFGS